MINTNLVKWSLEELSSIEEQNRLWLGQSQDEISSFEEACCGLFDDSGLDRAIQRKDSEAYHYQVIEKFKKLQRLISKIPNNLPPRDLIGLPEMKTIREVSSDLLFSINAVAEERG